MIFVVHGAVTIEGRTFGDGTAWHGQGAATIAAAQEGATCWRWDLRRAAARAIGPGITSREKLAARLDTLPAGDLLLRGDSVAFPPGGCAYLHRHQGPGHPLPARRRHPDRHPRPLDLLWSGRRLV